MNVVIQKAELTQIELLMEWRMEVLHEIFNVPTDEPMQKLERENRRYYQETIPTGGHIACFAYAGNKIIGCGGICIYSELPSPDNLSGKCAYLMNIYTRPQFRGQGVGKRLVKWLVKQAVQQNITKIYLESSKQGRPFYEGIGFNNMPDMMKLTAENGKQESSYPNFHDV